jgi:site-specific DNA-methyltransferase (adenine-specific)
MSNHLYYGDNLHVLRNNIADASVDLVYLDPPFNSNANYNLLFKSPEGAQSHAQIEAFEDTWHWTADAEQAFDEVMQSGHGNAAEMLRAMRSFLGENDMMAYLTMMAVRLIELHRVLKDTGSLYLHCDPTASHYLKIILDGIFGKEHYRNEIIWQRSNAHNSARQYGRIADTIFFYTKSSNYCWNQIYTEYSDAQLGRYKSNSDGRLYTCQDLTASRPNSNSGKFEWRGTFPSDGRGWGYTKEQLEKWWEEGKIAQKKDGTPRQDGLIVYLDEMPGKSLQSVWTDIPRISNTSKERLGYPTQKPLALLERIISVSSNEGDVVLDPFCGCGTATHAAQKLNRKWIGIDITHLSVSLIEKRLKDAFPSVAFEVHGTPKDVAGAFALAEADKYQFQWWAVSLVNAVPFGGKKKGADGGIDGHIYFKPDGKTTEKAIVSVKGGLNVQVSMIRDLAHVVDREKAKIGVFITLAEPTKPMLTEAIKAGYYETDFGKYPKIQILTVEELFAGKQPQIPLVDSSAFKKAAVESTQKQSKLL